MGYLKKIKTQLKRCLLAEAGYSMIEILVVMAISATALALLLPSVTDLNRPYIKTNAISKFMADLNRAQSHALNIGCLVHFTLTDNGYSYSCHYATDSGICPDNTSSACRIFSESLDEKIQITPEPAENLVWYFNSRGLLVDADGILTEANIDFAFLRKNTDDTFDKYADAEVLTTGVVSFIMS